MMEAFRPVKPVMYDANHVRVNRQNVIAVIQGLIEHFILVEIHVLALMDITKVEQLAYVKS